MTGIPQFETPIPGIPSDQQALLTLVRKRIPAYQTDDRFEQSNHFKGVIYVAVCAIANSMLGASVKAFRRERGISKIAKSFAAANPGQRDHELVELEHDHPLSKLLARPNQRQTFKDILQGWTIQYHLTGQARHWCVSNMLGEPLEVYTLPTALMLPVPPSSRYPNGGWRITPWRGAGAFIPGLGMMSPGAIIDARDMIEHRAYHPLSLTDGYSPLTAGSIQLDVLESIDQSRKSAMDHGFNPDAVIAVQGASPEVLKRVQADFESEHLGSDRHRKVLFTSGNGVDVDKLSTSPKEMDYGSGHDQMTKFALALFGVPPSIAGLSEATSYSQLYASLKQFYSLKMKPHCADIAEVLTRELAEKFGDDFLIQIEPPTIDDRDFDEKQWQDDAGHGAVTWNEYRGRKGLEPVDGGDVLMASGAPGQQPDPNADPSMMGGDDPEAGDPADDGQLSDEDLQGVSPDDVVEQSTLAMLGAAGDDEPTDMPGMIAKSYFDSQKHPRGNPHNKGQFSSNGQGGAGGGRAKVTSAKPGTAPPSGPPMATPDTGGIGKPTNNGSGVHVSGDDVKNIMAKSTTGELESKIQQHIKNGGTLVHWYDGKPNLITRFENGKMVDDKGQTYSVEILAFGTIGQKTGLTFNAIPQKAKVTGGTQTAKPIPTAKKLTTINPQPSGFANKFAAYIEATFKPIASVIDALNRFDDLMSSVPQQAKDAAKKLYDRVSGQQQARQQLIHGKFDESVKWGKDAAKRNTEKVMRKLGMDPKDDASRERVEMRLGKLFAEMRMHLQGMNPETNPDGMGQYRDSANARIRFGGKSIKVGLKRKQLGWGGGLDRPANQSSAGSLPQKLKDIMGTIGKSHGDYRSKRQRKNDQAFAQIAAELLD